MLRKQLSIVWFIGLFFVSVAQNVDSTTAAKIAVSFFKQQQNSENSPTISEQFTKYGENGSPLYYVYNFVGGGFVIVAADKRSEPIVAYSVKNYFSIDDKHPAKNYFLDGFAEGLQKAIQSQVAIDPQLELKWNKLISPQLYPVEKVANHRVEPLITSIWNQNKYYNWYCPLDEASPSGYDDRVPNGCVAVALAQIMYYHRYPRQGDSSNSYYCLNDGYDYGTLSANFSTATYDYEAMADEATGYSDAIAQLIYHIGVAVKMMYKPTGSGSYDQRAVAALGNFFRYKSTGSPKVESQYRYNYTDAQWMTLIENDIDRGLPLYYSACTNNPDGRDGCHAWVCDGYDNTNGNFLSFKWGWGGHSDGYYSITDMNAYTASNAIIRNIEPRTDTTNYFTGQKVLTALYGSFDDGSGYKDYRNNTNCSWLISPSAGNDVSKITLSVAAFSVAANDWVKIYAGNSTADPLVLTLNGGTLYSGTTIDVNAKEALIVFNSNASVTDAGFRFNYTVTTTTSSNCGSCTSPVISTSLWDSVWVENYGDLQNCNWIVAPTKATDIPLVFSEFAMSKGDYLEIYPAGKATITCGFKYHTLGLYRFSADNPPVLGQVYNVQSASALIRLASDNNESNGNFKISWLLMDTTKKDTNDIIDISDADLSCNIYPNPTHGKVNVEFLSNEIQNADISVLDITGKEIYHQSIQNGNNSVEIDLKHSPKGIYIFKMITQKGVYVRKIIYQ
ncbi:MAG: C10 family peptidase [Bacteroidales bacterium]|jgi:hypothetical protein|nr:C10 family peptidase [Bacteroidales bacterium]